MTVMHSGLTILLASLVYIGLTSVNREFACSTAIAYMTIVAVCVVFHYAIERKPHGKA